MSRIMTNPFTKDFGRIPYLMIQRDDDVKTIVDTFSSENPSSHIYLITGVRGTGKTVLMTDISNKLAADDSWVVIEISIQNDDLLKTLEVNLESKLSSLISGVKITTNFLSVDFSRGDGEEKTQIHITEMLTTLKKKNKRVLVVIDEAENSIPMKKFTSYFQILLKKDLPIFLIMTGLYDKIRSLQKAKNMTFLLRAPSITIEPLSVRSIATEYNRNINVDYDTAKEMAEFTKGYSFAFQLLGYYTYLNERNYEACIETVKNELYDNSYEKIWEELAQNSRWLLQAVAESNTNRISDIMDIAGWNNKGISPYREKLIKNGLLRSAGFGQIDFSLPLFRGFVLEKTAEAKHILFCDQCGSPVSSNSRFCSQCGRKLKR